ncbi:MAG: class I SAM-dependent methyltransferase [Termitinemataceae bacterium]|nr:MAG: class I SAM-dependent methyltransferase [Termitinemataceae bacterium]
MESYLDVYRKHDGKVSHKWIHTFPIYDRLFHGFRENGSPITILEIGVSNGGSLEIWEKYLPRNSQIHGIDINSKCCDLQFSKNINFHLGSAADNNFTDKEFNGIEFDIILDDGSHISKDVINTFVNMFPKIKAGGVYIVEDLHTSYWKNYGGEFLRKNSSIEFFKKLIDVTNYDYIKKGGKNKYLHGKELSLIKKYSDSISAISFFDSICAIEKFCQPKNIPFEAVISGVEDAINDSSGIEHIKNELQLVDKINKMYVDEKKQL